MFSFWKKRKRKSIDQEGLETVSDGEQSERPIYDVAASLLSDVGCVREVNEDCIRFVQPGDPKVVAKKGVLVLVCDGMGGHSAGEVASNKAIDVISRVYYEESGGPQTALKKGFNQASRENFEMAEKDEDLKGMGTTCTAVGLKKGSGPAR